MTTPMDRRDFFRLGALATGAALLPSFPAWAGVFPAGTALSDLTFRLQVATAEDFSPVSLVFDQAGLATTTATVGGLRPGARYLWRVSATDGTVTSPWSEAFAFTTGTAVGTETPAPGAPVFGLGQNYPNPVRDHTRIPFTLPRRERVTLSVVNLLGQHVLTLVDEERAAGRHEVAWDTAGLAAGTYVYTLRTETQHATRRLVVLP